jgi:hypothetical protein
MNNRYRIVLIVPAGYKHSLCFTEAAFLLKNSLNGLGKDCDIAINELAKDRTNVVLGYHLMQFGDFLQQYSYIPFQLEQLGADQTVFSDNVKMVLSRAACVWDYSLENIAFLAGHGIVAKHLPVGYQPALEMIPKGGPKDIDVLFFGSMAARRKTVLDELIAGGARVHALFGVYGKERDAFVARSRIVVNIHYYSAKIFEAVRVSYLLNNARCVVSEQSDVYPYPGVNMPLVPYDNLAKTCLEILGEKDKSVEIGVRNYNEFKKGYLMTELIGKVLDDK